MEQLSPQEMSDNAEEAADELEKLTKEAVEQVANWWAKWYMKAGHKRLGRKLLEHTGGK